MDQNPNTSLFTMNLDAQNSFTLRSMASWAKVLGVVSIILAGMFMVWGLVYQQTVSRLNDGYSGYRRSGINESGMVLAVYFIGGLIYAISGIFAINAANKISNGLKGNNMEILNAGFAGARNFFALWAILTIITLVILFAGLMAIM